MIYLSQFHSNERVVQFIENIYKENTGFIRAMFCVYFMYFKIPESLHNFIIMTTRKWKIFIFLKLFILG